MKGFSTPRLSASISSLPSGKAVIRAQYGIGNKSVSKSSIINPKNTKPKA